MHVFFSHKSIRSLIDGSVCSLLLLIGL